MRSAYKSLTATSWQHIFWRENYDTNTAGAQRNQKKNQRNTYISKYVDISKGELLHVFFEEIFFIRAADGNGLLIGKVNLITTNVFDRVDVNHVRFVYTHKPEVVK